MRETRDISIYTGSMDGLPQGPVPMAQLLRCLDTAFPARSPGFAEVCAPIWKSRDGVGWRAKSLGPHSEQSIFSPD